jgi:chromosomal replication initiator protein
VTTNGCEVVAALGETIAQLIGEPRYRLWFANHTTFSWDEDQLLVGVPNHFYLDWLQNTFTETVRAAAGTVFGRPMRVRFAIDAQLFQTARKAQAAIQATRNAAQHATTSKRREDRDPLLTEPSLESGPANVRAAKSARRWHRLSEFVVGPCNRLAHASALSVVETPGESANPLVLHGPVGTGKTHLLEGIYAGLRRHHPDWRVSYVTAEDFTNRFVQAMRLGKLSSFRKHFRECHALLVDDLHFLANKNATQEEFLHTFDALYAAGQQLILSCDCHPRLAGAFSPELTDRLLGGAVAGLAPPDAQTRMDILRVKGACVGTPIPDDVLRLISDQLRGNVRELQGALQTLWHHSRVAARPIDMALAREALGDLLRHAVRVVQLADIDRAVCQVLRLDSGALQSKHRAWAVSHPRMLAMYLARKHTAAAYSEIGHYFGGRNHSTAVAAEKKVRQWTQEDGKLILGEQHLRIREVIDLAERELMR